MKLFDLTKHRTVRILSRFQHAMLVAIAVSTVYFFSTISIVNDAIRAYNTASGFPTGSPDAAKFVNAAVNAAYVAQGTTGIAATFLSALLVAAGLLQVAIGNTIVRIENRRDRGIAKIDQLLAHRHLAIPANSVAASPEAAGEAHANSYWARLNAYAKLDAGCDAATLKENLQKTFKESLERDSYLTYMSQIFYEAELLSDLGEELVQENVDHIWASLSSEERILCLVASFLDVGSIKLPSRDNIRPWQAAVGSALPWGNSTISLEDVFDHALQSKERQDDLQRFHVKILNRISGVNPK